MALRLNGSNTGYVELDVPADAGSHTLILPDGGGTAHQVLKNSATAGTLEYGLALPTGNGTSGQYLQTDGLGGSSWQTIPTPTDTGEVWTSNYQTASSATSVLWTGIPPDARELIITFSEWTHDTNSSILCEIGTSSGLETSGYYQDQGYTGAGSNGSNNSSNPNWGNSGFISTIYKFAGNIVLRKATSGDHWVIDWTCGGNYGYMMFVFGHKTLSGTLERVQVRHSTGNLSGNFALHYLT